MVEKATRSPYHPWQPMKHKTFYWFWLEPCSWVKHTNKRIKMFFFVYYLSRLFCNGKSQRLSKYDFSTVFCMPYSLIKVFLVAKNISLKSKLWNEICIYINVKIYFLFSIKINFNRNCWCFIIANLPSGGQISCW